MSFKGAVEAIRKSYVALATTLLQRVDEGCAASKGLLKALPKLDFLVATYFWSDALAALTKQSIYFQRENSNIADIRPKVISTRRVLQAMSTQSCPYRQELE